MVTTVQISMSEVSESGKHYNGTFTIKTVLTRRDNFTADAIRREVLGPSPEGTVVLPDLQFEAYMLGQLRVRIVNAPEWWTNSNFGLDMEDGDIIAKLYALVVKEEGKSKAELKKESEKALEQLKKTPVGE